MTILEPIIDDISDALHTTATLKTDARAAKKIVSLVRALDNAEVAKSVLVLINDDDRAARDYLPKWSANVANQPKLKDTILASAELIDLIKPPVQTELITKHLDAIRKALVQIDEVAPFVKDFSTAPKMVHAKVLKVLRTAVLLELALTPKQLKLESISLSWYRFVYLASAHATLVQEIVLDFIEEDNAKAAVDVTALKKRFDSPSNRMKRAKHLVTHLRSAAESVEYSKEMKFQDYLQKVQEKSAVAN